MRLSIVQRACSLLLAASAIATLTSIFLIWRQPITTFLVDRPAQEITAKLESLLARFASQQLIEERLYDLLTEEKRNWLALESVNELALERGIYVSEKLQHEYAIAYDNDHSVWQNVEDCAACLWDAGNCELSPVLLCQAPAALSPIGDVAGIVRESSNYVSGNAVDEIELALSTIGLGAVVIAPITGSSSLSVKVGASLAKVARRMSLLSPKIIQLGKNTAQNAIDWKIMSQSSFGSFNDDLARAIRPEVIKPAAKTLESFGNMKKSVGLIGALHLTRYIDTPADAHKLSRISEVEKMRTVGIIEVLGKSKTLRAAMRYSNEALAFMSGLLGIVGALIGLMWNTITSLGLAILKKVIRKLK